MCLATREGSHMWTTRNMFPPRGAGRVLSQTSEHLVNLRSSLLVCRCSPSIRPDTENVEECQQWWGMEPRWFHMALTTVAPWNIQLQELFEATGEDKGRADPAEDEVALMAVSCHKIK